VDSTGYRRYGVAQVQQAQLVRRLRLLDMPVPDIKAVLAADDETARDAAIAQHLQRMEETLGRTTQVVASLRSLLRPPGDPLAVEYRTVPATTVIGIRAKVRRADVGAWCGTAFPRIEAAVAAAGTDPAGPGGATYDAAFFEQDIGEVLVFVPVAQPIPGPGDAGPEGIESLVLPAGRFSVAVHAGGYEDIDRTYGRLGSHVAEHDDPLPEPIREHYLVGPDRTPQQHDYRTEIWWPIRSHAAAARPAVDHPPITRPATDGTPAAGPTTHQET
jgi:effector-binding domain-containing protein